MKLGSFCSNELQLRWGVLQGSPLSLLLFNIYRRLLLKILTKHQIVFESYADDMHIYICVPKSNCDYTTLTTSLEEIQEWFATNHLKLNQSKTELVCFDASKQDQGKTLTPPKV